MAILTPDKVRIEHGLTINEKIIPWGATWPKDSGSYKKGSKYKADKLLSDGTGKVKGVTVHNTNDLVNVHEDAEQYTRATWPNANMSNARVHYYVDDVNAWQNLREDEIGWHAADGSGPGNSTNLAVEIIMNGSGSAEDQGAEENGALLAAILLHRHGLTINELYTHNHWMGLPDSIKSGAQKNCPVYLLPRWAEFKAKVAAKLKEIEAESAAKTNSDAPLWQQEGLAALVEAGVVGDAKYWESRYSRSATVGELVGLLGKLVKTTER
jgi:N-acetylmuramoyl-L-alanine amidase CwlA